MRPDISSRLRRAAHDCRACRYDEELRRGMESQDAKALYPFFITPISCAARMCFDPGKPMGMVWGPFCFGGRQYPTFVPLITPLFAGPQPRSRLLATIGGRRTMLNLHKLIVPAALVVSASLIPFAQASGVRDGVAKQPAKQPAVT